MNLKSIADELKKKLQQGVQTAGNAWNGYVQNVAKPMAVGVPQVRNAYQSIYKNINQPVANITGQYVQNQIVNPIRSGVQNITNNNLKPLQRAVGGLGLLQGSFNATPFGVGFNALTATQTAGVQSLKNKTPFLSNLKQDFVNPTSFAQQGLGINNPILAMGVDVLAGSPKSVVNAFKNPRAIGKGFSLSKNTLDELVRAEERLSNPKKFLAEVDLGRHATKSGYKLAEQEAIKNIGIQAKDTIDRLAGKYLPTDVLEKVAGNPKATIKALTDLHYKNGLANMQMGFTGKKDAQAGLYDVPTQNGTIKVEGTPVDISKGLKTFLSKDENGNWTVHEATTGKAITQGGYPTTKAAIEDARGFVDYYGIDAIKKQIGVEPNPPQQPLSTKGVEPLIAEARKYGSAEDFNNAIQGMTDAQAQKLGFRTTRFGWTHPELEGKGITLENIYNQSRGLTKGVESMTPVKEVLNKRVQELSNQGIIPPEVQKQQLLKDLKNISSGGSIPENGLKTKKLVERMSTSEKYAPELRQMLEGTYVPKSNVETIANAKKLVKTDAIAAESRAMNPQNAVDQAIGAELFNHYMDKGNVQRANAVLNATSGTNEGQMIQILSQYDKTSPQGAVRFARNTINNYNEIHPNNPLKLEDKTITDLYKMAKEIQGMPEGRSRNMASQQLIDKVNALVPSTIVDKAIAVWKAGLLTSFRTHERNIVGNSVMSASEIVKDVPAAFVDRMLSWKTGQRSMTPTVRGVVSGGKEGINVAKDVIKLGFDPNESITKFDIKKITWGDNAVEQALKKYTDVVFRSLGAEDKPFWSSSYARSLYDQAGTEALNVGKRGNRAFIENLVKNPTEIMKKNATIDANYATFHDSNMLNSAATNIKRALSKNELTKLGGELIMPFTGVPSSIAGKIVDYSPIGFVKGLFESGKVLAQDIPTLQRQAAQDVGRGVVGSALFALGAYLASKGLMTGQPKDAAEARQWELENKPYNSVLIGGKWRGIGSVGPQPLIMLAGAKAQEDLKQGGGGWGKFAGDIGKDYTSQTFLAGVQGPLNAISDPARYGGTYLKSQAGSVVPNIVGDASRALDTNQRETNTTVDALKARIPLLRNTLLPKRDALGNIMPQEPTGVGAFVDLFNSKTPISNPVVNELSRLNSTGNNATPGKLTKNQTIKGVKQTLTPEQLNALEAQVGPEVTKQLQALFNSSGYQKLGDEEKTNAIQSIITSTRKKIRGSADVNQTPEGQSGLVDTVKASDNTQSELGQYILVNPDTGSVKNIDLSTPIEAPKLTGVESIDKKLTSSYKSDLNSQMTDIVNLYKDGQLTIDQASSAMDKLQTQYDKAKGPKKPTKISLKVTKYTPAKITIKKKATLKVPTIKVAKPKIKKTKIRRFTIK